jgi:hypothetical protein
VSSGKAGRPRLDRVRGDEINMTNAIRDALILPPTRLKQLTEIRNEMRKSEMKCASVTGCGTVLGEMTFSGIGDGLIGTVIGQMTGV